MEKVDKTFAAGEDRSTEPLGPGAGTELFSLAWEVARQAHEGQKDRSGKPYFSHPVRVANRCRTENAKIVALLHDTIEDTALTAGDLRDKGFPEEIVAAVVAMTRPEDEAYEDYIDRAAADPIAREVKIADLLDNMDITRLTPPLTEKDLARFNKYLKAYRKITAR